MNRTLRAGLLASAVAFAATASQAASPPDSWKNLRVLDCDGESVTTYLTPAGFGTPFHIVESTDVIIPKYVEVTLNGATFVTLNVPGFDPSGPDVVACSYVDPVGLEVSFLGLRK